MEGGFPFEIKQPRYNIEIAIEEASQISLGKIDCKIYTSVEDLFEDLQKD